MENSVESKLEEALTRFELKCNNLEREIVHRCILENYIEPSVEVEPEVEVFDVKEESESEVEPEVEVFDVKEESESESESEDDLKDCFNVPDREYFPKGYKKQVRNEIRALSRAYRIK